MIRAGRIIVLLFACVSLAAPRARAHIPSPCLATLPCGISLVGTNNGVADTMGVFTITMRDIANNPWPGALVEISFARCCGDIRLTDPQPFVGGPVTGRVVYATTNASGIATFIITGAALGGALTPNGGCAEVSADGSLITDGFCHPRHLQVAVYDLNGVSMAGAGMGAADFGMLLNDFFGSADPDRSDYDYSVRCAKAVGAADLAKWLTVFFASGSQQNGPRYTSCP